MLTKTKILIAGIGGVGGYFGGLLAHHYGDKAEVDIVFYARGEHLQAIQTAGLKIVKGGSTFIAKPSLATNHPSAIGTVDFLLVATKSYDLEGVVSELMPCINQDTVVLPLLNGVDSSERIKKMLPNNLVLGGCTYIVSRLKKPGLIENTGHVERIYFGLDGNDSDRLPKLQSLLQAANIEAILSANITPIIWEKFVFLSAIATATSYFDASVGELLAKQDTYATVLALIEEVKQLAAAKNIEMESHLTERTISKLKSLPFETTTSLHADFQAKKPNNELEGLTGYVVNEGKKYGLKTALFAKMYADLAHRNSGS